MFHFLGEDWRTDLLKRTEVSQIRSFIQNYIFSATGIPDVNFVSVFLIKNILKGILLNLMFDKNQTSFWSRE